MLDKDHTQWSEPCQILGHYWAKGCCWGSQKTWKDKEDNLHLVSRAAPAFISKSNQRFVAFEVLLRTEQQTRGFNVLILRNIGKFSLGFFAYFIVFECTMLKFANMAYFLVTSWVCPCSGVFFGLFFFWQQYKSGLHCFWDVVWLPDYYLAISW